MPIKCYLKPNRKHKRKFVYCDLVRIAQYVYDSTGLGMLGFISELSPTLKEDLVEAREVLTVFLESTDFYSSLDDIRIQIKSLNIAIKNVKQQLATLPTWLRAILLKIGLFRMIDLVVRLASAVITVINTLENVRFTLQLMLKLVNLTLGGVPCLKKKG